MGHTSDHHSSCPGFRVASLIGGAISVNIPEHGLFLVNEKFGLSGHPLPSTQP